MDKETMYRKAFEKWGKELQFLMVIEECAEVQQAVSKMLREGIDDKELPIRLMEEIADVEIMFEQLDVYFKHTGEGNYRRLIEAYKKDKLKKLEGLLFSPI